MEEWIDGVMEEWIDGVMEEWNELKFEINFSHFTCLNFCNYLIIY
jgi:hypothetical protein